MESIFILSLLPHFIFWSPAFAQYSSTTPPTAAASGGLTPEMSASSIFASLATATPQQQTGDSGGPGDATSAGGSGNAAGASGTDTSSFTLSKGGLIAIVVVVAVVVIFGTTSTVLFYLAKKRSWEVRATIRRSAKRVATALTPRRSEFPSSVKEERSSKKMTRIDDVPPTPKTRSHDLEKGNMKMTSFEMKEPVKPSSKWGSKTDK